jgi:hypothetical protein
VGATQMCAQRQLNAGAVRSLCGGIVRWARGYREDGKVGQCRLTPGCTGVDPGSTPG